MKNHLFTEPLEPRTLLTSLPAGFEQTFIAQVPTTVASSMAVAPDGRVFIGDNRSGDVRLVENGDLLSTPFAHVKADSYRERGILGLTLDPDFADNGFVYVYYTHADPSNPNTSPNGAKNYLSRFKVDPNNPTIADANFGEQVLINNIPSDTGYHNGGFLRFGKDGMLYLAVGDLAASGTKVTSLSSYDGKVLRLNVENFPNIIPSDNPFVHTSGAIGTIYATGLRNPFTGDINPITGKIFVNDVGESGFEEVDDIQAGANYGWPTGEGALKKSGLTDPFYTYSHNGGDAAITGGVFYTGTQFPSTYQGKYFFADYINKYIHVLDPTTGKASNFASGESEQFLALANVPDGSIDALAVDGSLYNISYVGTGNRAPTAIASSNVANGALPLTVKFDGIDSSDPDGDPLSYAWDFGDGNTGSGAMPSHTYTTVGTFNATVTVSDGNGGSDVSLPLTIVAGNRAPKPVISLPASGATYAAGDAIKFSGSATDPEDGTLPASAYHWSIVFHHETHTHPFIDAIDDVKSGSFQIPKTGEVDPVQWYRVHLTVTDSGGLSTDTFVDVLPRKSTFTLASNIAGIQLSLDGAPLATPTKTLGVVGMTRNISAATSVILNGTTYQFVSWSDGGKAAHDISTPTSNKTYTATYKAVSTTKTTTLSAIADAYVRGGSSSTKNFGTTTTLNVKDGSGDYDREAYLKFDLTSISTIKSAKLRLFGSLNDVTAKNIVTSVYAASDTSWSESKITFKNRPATSGSALSSATVVDAIGRWYEFDITSYLKAQKAAGKKQVTLVLRNKSNASPYTTFNSREATTNRPQLVIA